MGKVYVSWKAVENFVENVDNFIRNEHPTCPGVYGVPRGGLCLAVMLSHKLSIPMLMSPVEGCLIVDDICDSGESLVHYVKNTSNPDAANKYIIATMFYKDNRLGIKPDIYYRTKGEDWIIYPFEASLKDTKAAFPDEKIEVI